MRERKREEEKKEEKIMPNQAQSRYSFETKAKHAAKPMKKSWKKNFYILSL